MNIVETLALGTRQLGDEYVAPAVSDSDARRILRTAWHEGIRYFDTAQVYGESERRCGEHLPADAKVITKLHPDTTIQDLETRLEKSCANLCRQSIWAVLLHRTSMLGEWDRGFREILLRWREKGYIQHLGLSVESADTRLPVLPSDLDVLQIPVGARARPPGRVRLFVRSIYGRGQVKDRPTAIRQTLREFPSATLLVGAETVEQVLDNCRIVRSQ